MTTVGEVRGFTPRLPGHIGEHQDPLTHARIAGNHRGAALLAALGAESSFRIRPMCHNLPMRNVWNLLSAAWMVFGALALHAPVASAFAQEVSFANFGSPRVLDFGTAVDGPTAGNAPIFTDFGITSIGAITPEPGPDGYNGGSPFYRALFHSTTEGLIFVSRGVEPWFDRRPTFTIALAEERFLFGVAPVDTLGEMRIRFRNGGAQVGEVTFVSTRESTHYFHSTLPFDEVVIDEPGKVDGWGIDNLTLDNIAFAGDPRKVPTTRAVHVVLVLGILAASAWAARRSPL